MTEAERTGKAVNGELVQTTELELAWMRAGRTLLSPSPLHSVAASSRVETEIAATNRVCQLMPAIPSLRKLRQEDFHDSEACFLLSSGPTCVIM